MALRINLTGQTFGRWKVESYAYTDHRSHSFWNCCCECGTKKPVLGNSLRRNKSISCGCYQKENPANRLRPYESRYNVMVGRSDYRNLGAVMFYEEYLCFTNRKTCYYCGGVVDWSPYDVKNNGSMPVNLDRVDSSKGYVFHNCVVCCGDCNQMKMDFTLEDFKARIKRIAMHLGL